MTSKTVTNGARGRLSELSSELKVLREKLKAGGGEGQAQFQHEQGKLTARERIKLLLDEGEPVVEVGLLVAYDSYDGLAPGAGVITCVGRALGREVVVVANDATVKAGAWWPETIKKILRAQEIAMRCRIPIVYLVDSVGVNLPYQSGVFPGQYGAARIFYYNSLMRRYLRIPQLSAVMGPCIGGSAYLAALSDVVLMVEGTSFMGLGDPKLVEGTTGQTIDAEELGGARVHTEVTSVAHYMAEDDHACIKHLRALLEEMPAEMNQVARVATPPKRLAYELYDLLPEDHRQPYDVRAVLECILDGEELDEFQPEHAREMICGTALLEGAPVGVIANARGMFKSSTGATSNVGGILYVESARKVRYFIEMMNRHQTPLLFVQDVSGFMIGSEAEHSGMIRAGAEFVEAMATATVPKLVLTLNHAFGAGYYAMSGQGFDPNFIVSLPTGRMGIMESETAVREMFGSRLDELKEEGALPDEDLRTRMDEVRAEHEKQLDARFAAARGFVDEVLLPEELRPALGLMLKAALQNSGPHVGPFQITDLER